MQGAVVVAAAASVGGGGNGGFCSPVRSFGRLLALSVCVLAGSELARIVGLLDPRVTAATTTAPTALRDVESSEVKRVTDERDELAMTTDTLFRDNLELVQPRPVNISIVLVGDSVTRYQYLSLAYFLRYGRWYDPRENPSVVYCHTFHHPRLQDLDWAEYYFQTNRLLYPNEICDCQRYSNFQLERRYFYDSIRNNKLVYINLNGDEPTDTKVPHTYFGGLNPHDIYRNFSTVLDRLAPPARTFRQKRMIEWQYSNWSDVLRYHVGQLDMSSSTTVLINAGLHRHSLRPSDFVNLTKNDANTSPMHVVWKTTTYTKRHVIGTLDTTESEREQRQIIDDTDQQFCHAMKCLDVSWTRNVSRSNFFDMMHYREPVYRLLNEQLLEFVDAIPPGYVRMDRQRVLSPTTKMATPTTTTSSGH